jgi:hypothetical protein
MTQSIRAISLWQPWASLVALGEKKIETRSWRPRQEGPLLIHAAKRWKPDQQNLCFRPDFTEALDGLGINKPMPVGGFIALVSVARFVQTDGYFNLDGSTILTDKEFAFGDFGTGRYGWELDNVFDFETIVYARGRQGLFIPSHSQLSKIRTYIPDIYERIEQR